MPSDATLHQMREEIAKDLGHSDFFFVRKLPGRPAAHVPQSREGSFVLSAFLDPASPRVAVLELRPRRTKSVPT
jgi:hypothetical protein